MVDVRSSVRLVTFGAAAAMFVASAVVVASSSSHADGVDLTGANPPSTQQLIQALTPQPQPMRTRGLTTRAIRPVMNPDGTPAAPPPAMAEVAKPKVMLTVNFAYNSDQISPESRLVLQRLGEALNSRELSGYRFQIDGHTDSVGGADFNRRLSERRAASVRQFLVADLDVAQGRLSSHGYGKEKLLDPRNPTSGVNRRVEITNIGQ